MDLLLLLALRAAAAVAAGPKPGGYYVYWSACRLSGHGSRLCYLVLVQLNGKFQLKG
jgi:hypothetical protein